MARIEKGTEPTAEERRKMTGLLLAARVLYEKSAGAALPGVIKAESDAKAEQLRRLTNMEAEYAKRLEFNKIAAVKAERERLTKPIEETPGPPKNPSQPPPPAPERIDVVKVTDALRDTRWHISNVRGHPAEKHWIRFNADGSTHAGWHNRKGTWSVSDEGIVEARISYKKGHVSRFKLSSDLQAASSLADDGLISRIKESD